MKTMRVVQLLLLLMLGWFFQRNPQRFNQHQFPRRGGGFTAPQIVIHTYEAPHTRSLTAAALWLTQRTDPGSYHCLAGAAGPRDVLQLAPWSHETWHCVPSNNWSIGISMVAYAGQWNQIPATARDNLVKSAAYAAANAAKWLQATHGRNVQPRIINRTQAMAKSAGFISHAAMDPGRRTDPGSAFPWNAFMAEYNRLMSTTGGGGSPAPDPKPEPTPEPDPLEVIMSWYKNRAEFERTIRAPREIQISGATRRHLEVDSITELQADRYGAATLFEQRDQHAKVMTALAALTANQNGVTAADVAKELAPLLLDDLQATVTEIVEASEGRDADEIALAVVTEMSHRLNQGA